MYLKKASWGKEEASSSSSSSSSSSTTSATAVDELVSSLKKQRVYREVTLALRTGLHDASANFSFLRVRGLRNLLKFLKSVTESDSTILLFCFTQSVPDLQVVPVLFQNSLRQAPRDDETVPNLEHLFSVEPVKITSPSTHTELALALRLLQGCCLLHRDSAALAFKCNALQVLMDVLSSRGVLERVACLDALVSILLDSSSNQMEFEACHGIEKIAELIKDKQVDDSIRLKCGEFLLLLIGHLNGKERPTMSRINDEIPQLLGEKSASLIWAASQFGSTLDPEQRQTALHIHAGRVLESLELD
ncbi:hypothetical protein Sjap_021189 [Stephania japonica]|uniref:Uncharacterized protein n=1 Tax=Stephania japonica TaxID=461633 RepID=A0AAP0I107_9MAGN